MSTITVPGLAPSTSLAPSATLAPQDTTYLDGPPDPILPVNPTNPGERATNHAIAMAVGTFGILVDVSSYVEYGEGITYRYGRDTQFDDAQPGTWTFVLNNSDGRFTPENPYSPYATKVVEGMVCCWQLGARLIRGTILTISIPSDEANWNQISITCDDMLGTAARHQITSIADGLSVRGGQDLMWLLDDDGANLSSPESNQDGLGAFVPAYSNPLTTTQVVTYGINVAPGLPGAAVTVAAAPGETNWYGTKYGNTSIVSRVTNPALAAGQNYLQGFWNMWVYPQSKIDFVVAPAFAARQGLFMRVAVTPTTMAIQAGTNTPVVVTLTAQQQLTPHYVSMAVQYVWQTSNSTWALFTYLYIDGTNVGLTYWTDPTNGTSVPATAGAISPTSVGLSVSAASTATVNTTGTVQRVSHTTDGSGSEQNALLTTLDGRRQVLDNIAPEISTAVYVQALNKAPIGFPDAQGASILDIYNDITRTEAGHIFTQTTGQLLNPAERILIRGRDRPTAARILFDAVTDADGPPTFIRDLTNVARQVDVAGPTQTVTVNDPTITGPYVAAGTSETVLYAEPQSLREWGQDRLQRGKNRAIRTQSFAIDTATVASNKIANVLTLVPGDRIRITNLPQQRLGFPTYDAWVLGASESHRPGEHRFEFTLQPVLPDPAVYDTGRYAAAGDATLNTALAAADTSVVIATSSQLGMSTEVPYTILIDTEQITLTAFTGTTGATTSFTAARATNGTTAAAHNAGAVIEITPTAIYAY